jgi:DNA-binding NarL/FixJ family response regulator
MKKIRILVVEDQNVVREGLVAILNFQTDFEVVGEAEDGIRAVEMARKTRPDVILLDMVMPRQDGLMTSPKLKLAAPEARVLVLSSFAESDRVYQAIKAGALGYMLKDATRVQLLQAIRDMATGKAQLQPSIAMKVFREMDRPSEGAITNQSLTRRELEALRLIARGFSNPSPSM